MPPIKLKRGGAHNLASRRSWQLRERDCPKLINASLAAWQAGMPLNRFITIAWGRGGVPASEAVEATGHFVRLAREWMRTRGYQMPWTWVQEGSDRFGQHAHILIHVPTHLAPLFRRMPLRWTKLILPKVYVPNVLQTQRLKSAAWTNSDAYQAELIGKVHYMLKCAPAQLETEFGLCGRANVPWGQQCLVEGKRAGVWQGWKAVGVNGSVAQPSATRSEAANNCMPNTRPVFQGE